MESPIFGEILVLFLMLLCCGRMFILKYGKVDSLTILAPISLLLAVLQIFAWGADVVSLIILVVALFCFFTNFRALLRFTGGLYVDHYNFGFKFGAFIVIVLSLAGIVLLGFFKPEIEKNSDLGVEQKKFYLNGDFIGGFEESGAFQTKNAEIYEYKSTDTKHDRKQAVIILSDKRADAIEYFPLMKHLAAAGYTVFSGDFYARDVKWFHTVSDSRFLRKFTMRANYYQNKVKFEAQKEFYSFNSKRELEAMVQFVSGQFDSIYVIGDWMSDIAMDDFVRENPSAVCGTMKLTELEGFETAGFGFVQQTNPLYAAILGFKRENLLNLYDKIVNQIDETMPEVIFEEETAEEPASESDSEVENTEVQEETNDAS